MDDIEKRQRIETEPDFVAIKRLGFSLKAVMERYPDGAPDNVIAQALLIPEGEVEVRYQNVVSRIRECLGVVI